MIVDCTLSPEGKVTHTRIVRGMPVLDGAALEAVKQWVFAPTVVDGTPVSVTITVKVPFKLR